MDDEVILVSRGDVREIVLNRPSKLNALNVGMRDTLLRTLRAVASDPDARGIILRGAGSSFCSGGDLTEFGVSHGSIRGHIGRVARSVPRMMLQLSDQLVCGVHGACVGAGLELACFAGYVVADESAYFSLPEVRMGLLPGMGGTVSVLRRVGRGTALEMMLTGARLSVQDALVVGIVDEVVARGQLAPRLYEVTKR
jgi:enoyl-CoA hydratase/carnithine racemase